MKTNFIPRDLKKEKSNLYLHITGNSKRERLNLDIEIDSKFWDKKKQRLSVNKIENENLKNKLKDFNLIIDNVEAKITNIKTAYRLAEQVLTPLKLRTELIEDMPRVNCNSFFQKALELEKRKVSPGTYRKLKAVLKKVKEYNAELIFQDLNLNWFDSYRNHLFKLGNKSTTINANLKIIKKFIKIAIKIGIKIPCNLDDLKIGSTAGTKTSLQPYELKKLKEFHDSIFINEVDKLVLGYFLIACLTGLRFADLMDIDRKEAESDGFNFKAMKAGKQQNISLNKTAKSIIKNNKDLFSTKFTNQFTNRQLKVIVKNLGINANQGLK
jgi:integrase